MRKLVDALRVLCGTHVAVERGHAYRINGALCVLSLMAAERWKPTTPELIGVGIGSRERDSEPESSRDPGHFVGFEENDLARALNAAL